MKKTILFAASALIMSASFGQVNIRIGQHGTTSSWRPNTAAPVAATATSVAPAYVQEIIAAVGLKPSFELTASTQVPNAAAVVYGGKRYLLYNPTFINNLVRQTGTKWAAVSVLAHEIGHHLNGHTVTGNGSQPAVELEADEFSGFVLRKLGASLTDAQVAMKTLATATASRTHPAQYDRLSSIAKGWQDADDQIDGRYIAKVPDFKPSTPVATQPSRGTNTSVASNRRTVAQPTVSNRNILGAITFNADPNSQYYVTSQYNVVKVRNNQQTVVGKLSRLNSRNYPYVISDSETQLLVDARGTILTRQGRQVGTLTAANAYNSYTANN